MRRKKNKRFVFEFDTHFETGGYVLAQVGRLYLGDGSIVRLLFTPEGLKIGIDKMVLLKSKCILKTDSPGCYVSDEYMKDQGLMQ